MFFINTLTLFLEYLQRFQSPYLEILQNANKETVHRITSGGPKSALPQTRNNVLITQMYDEEEEENKQRRPQTAKL